MSFRKSYSKQGTPQSFQELYFKASLGLMDDNAMIIHRAIKSGASSTADRDVWGDQATMVYQTTAQTVELISTSLSDTAAGTGARTVRVYGLDSNYDMISEDVTMAGTTASTATTASFLRVNYMKVLTAGSGLSSAGLVIARVPSAGDVMYTMSAPGISGNSTTGDGDGDSHICMPNGWTGYLVKFYQLGNGTANADAKVEGIVHFGGVQTSVLVTCSEKRTSINMDFDCPISVAPKHDFKFINWEHSAANRTYCSFTMLLLKDDIYTGMTDNLQKLY